MSRPRLLALALAAACTPDDLPDPVDDAPESDAPSATDMESDTDTDASTGLLDDPVGAGRLARDPEVLESEGLVTWQDQATGKVWVADIDPSTGQWVPEDGRGKLIGVAPPIAGVGERARPWSHNGPEWGVDRQGPAVFFTSFDADRRNQPVIARPGKRPVLLARDDEHRSGVLPQIAPASDQLAFVYFMGHIGELRASWRWVGDTEDRTFPLADTVEPGPRWIPGEDALTTPTLSDGGWAQVGRYDLHTGETTLLTTDEGHKSDPFVFEHPDGTRRLVTTVATEVPGDVLELARTRVAVYRETAEGFVRAHTFGVGEVGGGASEGEWSHYSTKPVVVGDEAFVVFVATQGLRRDEPCHVYAARLDGSDQVQLTRNDGRWHGDPEVFVLSGEPLLYYQAEEDDGKRRIRVMRRFLPR